MYAVPYEEWDPSPIPQHGSIPPQQPSLEWPVTDASGIEIIESSTNPCSSLLPDRWAATSQIKSPDLILSAYSEGQPANDIILSELFLRTDTFYERPGREIHSVYRWDGPNLFSAFTSAADIFRYLSDNTLNTGGALWLEVHFMACDLHTWLPDWGYPFFLSASDSSINSLAGFRSQIAHTVLSRAGYQCAEWSFRLILRPRHDLEWRF